MQASLDKITQMFKFDYFFSGSHTFSKIRATNLLQYVAPYKVLDMRDIATAFNISIDQVENELSEQISQGKIKAKIDSYKKVLLSRTVNKEVETYKKVEAAGKKFFEETEMGLIKMSCMKKGIILRDANKHMLGGFMKW